MSESDNPEHEEAALAFSINFEFAQQFVRAQGRETMTMAAKTVLARWLSIMVDGADEFIDQENQAGTGGTPELRLLGQQAAAALSWLEELSPSEDRVQ